MRSIVFAAALFVTTLPVHAQLVAENDFTLAPGQAHGTNSGFGFGAWQTQNGDTNSYAIHTAGLSYAGLATSGNSLVGGGAYLGSGMPLNIPTGTTPWSPWRRTVGSDRVIGAEGTTLWGSILLNQFIETEDLNLSLHAGGISSFEDTRSVRVRVSNGRFTLGQNGQTAVSTNVRRIPGQTNLLVFKFDFLNSSTDRVTLYINPTVAPGLTTPDVPGTVINTSSDYYFRSLQFYPDQNRLTGAIDAVRFGGSFSDVTPRASTAVTTQRPNRAFFVGNSVTDTINQENLRQLALQRGNFMPWGRQMIPGSPLDNLWNNPGGGFTNAPYNYPQTAFTNPEWSWDSIVLQPFDRQLSSDLDYAQRFMNLALSNPANSQTQFYIYSRWPRKDADGSLDFQAKWDRPYNGGFGEEETRDYFVKLMTQINLARGNANKPVLLVPVGDVLYELDKRMEAGQIPGYTDVAQLYSDGIHFTNEGSYVVGLTYYAVLFKTDPRLLTLNPWNLNNPALEAAFKQTVWDVVRTHPHAGVIPEPGIAALTALAGLTLRRRRA
jgi:hypothetical protein